MLSRLAPGASLMLRERSAAPISTSSTRWAAEGCLENARNRHRSRFMHKSSLASFCRAALWSVLALGSAACRKDEPPPPLPAPKPVEAVAEAPLELKPEDAGAPIQPKAVPPKGG